VLRQFSHRRRDTGGGNGAAALKGVLSCGSIDAQAASKSAVIAASSIRAQNLPPKTGFRSSRTDDGHKNFMRGRLISVPECRRSHLRVLFCPVTSISSRFEISIAVRSGYREVRVREPSGRSNRHSA